jgi:hypothetical protein
MIKNSIFIDSKKPGFWVFYYFSIAFLFSIIYFFNSGSFYYSTIRYEKISKNLIENLKDTFSSYLSTRSQEDFGSDSRIFVNYISFDQILDTYKIDLHGTLVSKNTTTYIKNISIIMPYGDKKDYCLNDRERFDIKVISYTGYTRFNSGKSRFGKDTFWSGQSVFDLNTVSSILFSASQDRPNPKFSLTIYKNTCEMFKSYRNSIMGESGKLTSNIFRMLYFSFVTITTIGYGDILPITDEMRILIALEAILGTVISGGFLWSLTNRIK